MMAIKLNNIDLTYLTNEPTFRSDATFVLFDIDASQTDFYRFDELFEIVSDDEVDSKDLTIFKYAEIGNVSSSEDVYPVLLDMDDQNDLNANYFKKISKGDIIRVKENDILISKVRPYLKKILLIDDSNCDILYTSSFIHLRPRKSPRILFYLLKSHFIEYLNSISRQGKGYPTLNEHDLNYLKFSKSIIDVALAKEESLLLEISKLENQIKELKRSRVPESVIIDNILGTSFNWDFETFKKKKEIRTYQTSFADLSANYDYRMSAKFHRPSGKFVYEDITKMNCLRIKNYISEPISLGASVSPSDFDNNGEYYYISMATVKNYKVELDETLLLSDNYVKQPKVSKKKVAKGDIIMTRSGAAIGKFALVEGELNAIHADFTMKIRLSNIDKLFAYYYFRSVYFQYLIEINYKGLQNNNIFPNQVQEFPIPDIPLKLQNSIVEKIRKQIDKQNESMEEIRKLREKIDSTMDIAIRS